MRRKRIDYEYRDRRDEINVNRQVARRQEVRRQRQRVEQKPISKVYNEIPPRAAQGKRNMRRKRLVRKRRVQGFFLVFGILFCWRWHMADLRHLWRCRNGKARLKKQHFKYRLRLLHK